MIRLLSLIITVIVFGSLALGTIPTYASGMTVTPTYMRFSISNKKPSSTSSVSLKNNGSEPVSYKASVVDVDAETGTLLPLGTTSETTAKIFSVSDTDISLQPNQLININVTANNFAELSPGGHYATLYLQQVNKIATKTTVPINQVVIVGLFLTKEDGVIRDLSFSLPDKKLVWFWLPKTQLISVLNNGNVEVVPRGYIALVKGTKTYVKTLFNETSQSVFPYKSKQYNIILGKSGIFWPGKYTKIVSLRYDGDPVQKINYSTVWYFPIWSVLLSLTLVYVAFTKLIMVKFVHKIDDNNISESIDSKTANGNVSKKTRRKTKKNKDEPERRKVGVL